MLPEGTCRPSRHCWPNLHRHVILCSLSSESSVRVPLSVTSQHVEVTFHPSPWPEGVVSCSGAALPNHWVI